MRRARKSRAPRSSTSSRPSLRLSLGVGSTRRACPSRSNNPRPTGRASRFPLLPWPFATPLPTMLASSSVQHFSTRHIFDTRSRPSTRLPRNSSVRQGGGAMSRARQKKRAQAVTAKALGAIPELGGGGASHSGSALACGRRRGSCEADDGDASGSAGGDGCGGAVSDASVCPWHRRAAGST